MMPDSFHFPSWGAVALALVSLVIVPLVSAFQGRETRTPTTAVTGEAEGASCVLPPALDIASGPGGTPAGIPVRDRKIPGPLKTATFALG